MRLNNPFSILSGTFANRPSAALGGYYRATDLGNYGALLESNGTSWTPVGGSCVLYQSGAATPTTAAATETNLAVITIPAGLLTSKGRVDIEGVATATGTAGNKTPRVRISSTSGDTTGGTVIGGWTLTNTNLGAIILRSLWANASTTAQITGPSALLGPGAGNGAIVASTIDTTAVWYVNLNGSTVSGDTIGFQGVSVRWIE